MGSARAGRLTGLLFDGALLLAVFVVVSAISCALVWIPVPVVNAPCRIYRPPQGIADGVDFPGMLAIVEDVIAPGDPDRPVCRQDPNHLRVAVVVAALLSVASIPACGWLISVWRQDISVP